jgi:hypothetical protein
MKTSGPPAAQVMATCWQTSYDGESHPIPFALSATDGASSRAR